MTTEQIKLELPKLRSQTVAIAGKLKTLWRSLSIDDTDNDDSLFNQNLGDGGDSYIVETLGTCRLIMTPILILLILFPFNTPKNWDYYFFWSPLINDVATLHKALSEFEQNLTIPESLTDNSSEALREHYELTLQAESLALMLNKSDVFDYFSASGAQGVAGSLDLLFSLVTQISQGADRLYFTANNK